MKATSTSPLRISFFFLFAFYFSSAFAFDLVCPSDKWIDCGDEIYNLSIYGNAQYHDYSGWHDAGSPYVHYDLNSCGLGTIERTWTVYNPYENKNWVCTQTIYVEGSYFNESNITWPGAYIDVSGCNPDISPNALPYGFQKPTWTNGSCALIGSSYTDKVFYFNGACKKIIRTWEIINCCVHNPYTGAGSFKFNQEINVTISDVPQVTCAPDITVESYNCQGAYVDVPGIVVPNTECSEFVTIMNDSPYSTSGENASGNYPLGTTIVTFTADFGCWQKTMCQISVTVLDKTAPTPYCIYGLSMALMGIDADNDGINEDGMIEVWASDFDKGSFPSCNSNSPLQFSFSSDVTDKNKTFTCEDVGRNDVEIWVTDQYGRQNYCNTYVRIQNNAANIENCEDSDDFSSISGQIQAHYGKSMGYMLVKAEATSHEGTPITSEIIEVVENIIDSSYTANGTLFYIFEFDTVVTTITDMVYPTKNHYAYQYSDQFVFDDMEHFNDYKIFGIASDPNNELIDLADISLLESYLLGESTLTAYQKMAADVNNDGQIDESDLDLLIQINNGNVPSDFDTDWHFMDKGFDVENMEEGHECEEFCHVKDLKEDTYKVNLIGFRRGDLTDDKMSESDILIAEYNLAGQNVEAETIALREALNSFNVELSPNPFSNSLTVTVEALAKGVGTCTFRNELGQVLLSQKIPVAAGSNQISIDVNKLSHSGLYFYEFVLGTKVKTGKLIKVE